MPTAVIISLATGGPPAPPDINTGYAFSDKKRNTTRMVKRNTTRLSNTRRKSKGCC